MLSVKRVTYRKTYKFERITVVIAFRLFPLVVGSNPDVSKILLFSLSI